jgi:hypothetical protein
MTSRGRGPRRVIIFLLLVACTRLYGALLVLYPKAFRQRYYTLNMHRLTPLRSVWVLMSLA